MPAINDTKEFEIADFWLPPFYPAPYYLEIDSQISSIRLLTYARERLGISIRSISQLGNVYTSINIVLNLCDIR